MHINTASLPFFGRKSDASVHSKAIGWIAVLMMVAASSISTPFAKQVSTSLSALSMLFLSEAIALLFTILSFGFVPLLRELAQLKRRQATALVVVAVLNSIIAPLLIFHGLSLTKAANAELFLRSNSFFLFIFAFILLKEKLSRTHVFAASAVLFGVALVALRGFQNGITPLPGDIFILSGAITYALGDTFFKKKIGDLHPEVVLFGRGVLAISVFFAVSPFLDHTFIQEVRAFPHTLLVALIGYGAVSRFLFLFSFYEAIERLEVHTVSMMLPLGSVGSLVVAALYLGESIQWYHIAGGGFIILGSLMMQFLRKQKKRHASEAPHHLHHFHRRHV